MVAEDLGVANYAALLLRIEYEIDTHNTDLGLARHAAYEPPKRRFGLSALPRPRGDPQGAFNKAAIRIENEYRIAIEHHNPIEPHASTVIYEGDGKLTIHDKTQGAQNSQK